MHMPNTKIYQNIITLCMYHGKCYTYIIVKQIMHPLVIQGYMSRCLSWSTRYNPVMSQSVWLLNNI